MPEYELRRALVIWGDGGQGRLIDLRPSEINSEGISVQRILFQPTEELIQRENITDEDLSYNKKGMWKEYPEKMFQWLDKSPRDAVLLILCNFKGGKTVLTELTKGLIEYNVVRDEIENNLKAMVAGLTAELGIFMHQREQIEKKHQEIRGLMKDKKDDDKSDED